MNQGVPEDWDEKRIQNVIKAYEKDADGRLLNRAYRKRSDYAFVEVPKALLPEVRKLVARYEMTRKKT